MLMAAVVSGSSVASFALQETRQKRSAARCRCCAPRSPQPVTRPWRQPTRVAHRCGALWLRTASRWGRAWQRRLHRGAGGAHAFVAAPAPLQAGMHKVGARALPAAGGGLRRARPSAREVGTHPAV